MTAARIQYDLLPGIGVGSILLGMTRVEAILAMQSDAARNHGTVEVWIDEPRDWYPHRTETLFMHESRVQVAMTDDGPVDSIEICGNSPKGWAENRKLLVDVSYDGLCLLSTPATVLLEHFCKQGVATGDTNTSFPTLGIQFWRSDESACYFETVRVFEPRSPA
jgi:hypothetical protein